MPWAAFSGQDRILRLCVPRWWQCICISLAPPPPPAAMASLCDPAMETPCPAGRVLRPMNGQPRCGFCFAREASYISKGCTIPICVLPIPSCHHAAMQTGWNAVSSLRLHRLWQGLISLLSKQDAGRWDALPQSVSLLVATLLWRPT